MSADQWIPHVAREQLVRGGAADLVGESDHVLEVSETEIDALVAELKALLYPGTSRAQARSKPPPCRVKRGEQGRHGAAGHGKRGRPGDLPVDLDGPQPAPV